MELHFSIANIVCYYVERLLFLDQTLERMILRFEEEYPECRLSPHTSLLPPDTQPSDSEPSPTLRPQPTPISHTHHIPAVTDNIITARISTPPALSRTGSDVSLASRSQLFEEGRMHRFGQQVRREVLRPQQLDHAHGTTGEEREARHLQLLREKLEGISGGEFRGLVEERGVDGGVRELVEEAEGLRMRSSESSKKDGGGKSGVSGGKVAAVRATDESAIED